MKVFDVSIKKENDQDAIDWARRFVFCECETDDVSATHYKKNSRYIDTVQGDVEVWYDFAADFYWFIEA